MKNKSSIKKIEPKAIIKEKIFSILNKKEFTIFLFWSRVTWNYKKNSDYDIWILQKNKNNILKYSDYLNLKIKLDDLPYLIDLVDFNNVSEEFKTLALKKIEIWN